METAPAPNLNPENPVVELSPYERWKAEPTPQNMSSVVKSLDGPIRQTLHSMGAGNDPYLLSKARTLAAGAVQTYNPEAGAGLHTWVNRQLMPITRMRREKQTAIKIPESVQLDAYRLMQAEREFEDTHGREPDVEELADAVSMPVSRIAKVRERFVRIMHDDAAGASGGEEATSGLAVEHTEPDFGTEAVGYVHHESYYIDRKILEHKTGYGGAEILNGAELAAKLKISPAQVTRRAAKLTYKINQYTRWLEDSQ